MDKRNAWEIDVSLFTTALQVFAVAAGLAGTGAAAAEHAEYPNRPITVIVPYAAGGPSDLAIRTIADRMAQALGQPLVTENVPGGGSLVGTARAARAKADGYTLLIHQPGLVIAPVLYPRQAVDPLKSFTAVGMVNTSYSFLIGSTAIPPKNFKELVAWMKGKPAIFAHPGIGTLAHVQAIVLARDIGVEVTMVGYRGGGPAVSDIVGGHADLLWAAPTTSAELIKAGKIQGFVFGAPHRYAPLPAIPAVGEVGYPDLDFQFWQALFAPAGTPAPIIDRLNSALRETLADERIKAAYVQRGVELFPPDRLSPAAANDFVAAEAKKWSTLVRAANIEPDAN
jgi:tripartite-type tricarboxylate transporter receptor subunit TctC